MREIVIMKCQIVEALNLNYSPVAIIFTNQKPKEGLKFEEGRWGCVVSMLNKAAMGETVIFDRKTHGCLGGGVGLGFGNTYGKFPGGIEYFLSTGKGAGYIPGEAYKKTPEMAKCFVDNLPIVDIPFTYVVFKPLEKITPEDDPPQVISFYANTDQISALVVLANYGRESNDNVIIPFAGGCQTVCLLPYHEAQQATQRAVIGLTDISARLEVPRDILSFSVPYNMFLEMEENAPSSFLTKASWKKHMASAASELEAAKKFYHIKDWSRST
jgi:uncharacterized protein (DUF169 family)